MRMIFRFKTYLITLALLSIPVIALAAEEVAVSKFDTGDTAWVLVSAALVMLMTPGLALFYGGMVREKNVLSMIMQSFFIVALISVQWALIGYTLTFGPDVNGLIGGIDWFGLNGVGQNPNPDYSSTIPHLAFAAYQCMFAVIAPALITGSFAERMKFPVFAVFTLLWATLIYDPMAHWVWGVGGWLRAFGALDFAGGTVIHVLSGVSGLIVCLMLGKRKGYGTKPMAPHHLPMTVLGAALLWFGWFGFNAGSALGANGLAASAFVVTNTAAAAATLSWVIAEWFFHGKPTVLGAASGCVAGLVAITPAAGFVSTLPAVLIGLIAGGVCYLAVAVLKAKLGYDDSLDAFGVHGIGGTWGAIATGLFASKAVNPAGADGAFFGNPEQLSIQLITIAVAWVLAIAGTYIILKGISLFTGLRTDESAEITGLDISEHGESAYAPDFMAGSLLSSTTGNTPQEKTVEKVTLA